MFQDNKLSLLRHLKRSIYENPLNIINQITHFYKGKWIRRTVQLSSALYNYINYNYMNFYIFYAISSQFCQSALLELLKRPQSSKSGC